MKVKKIPARDAHVGMSMVTGTKEDHQIHKINEVHIRPKEDYGMISVGVGRVKFHFRLSEEPSIRIIKEENEDSKYRNLGAPGK